MQIFPFGLYYLLPKAVIQDNKKDRSQLVNQQKTTTAGGEGQKGVGRPRQHGNVFATMQQGEEDAQEIVTDMNY